MTTCDARAARSDLEQEKQQRRLQDAARWQSLSESVGKLEKSLEASGPRARAAHAT